MNIQEIQEADVPGVVAALEMATSENMFVTEDSAEGWDILWFGWFVVECGCCCAARVEGGLEEPMMGGIIP